MFPGLERKRVLITGAGSGIGAETAKLFSACGARVLWHFRKDDSSKRAYFVDPKEVVYGDLLESVARKNLIPLAVVKLGGIDILVNNAGACPEYKHFSELSEEEWDRMFELQVKAPFMLSKAAFGHMKAQNWGRIINISTVAIEYGGVNNTHYIACKAAMEVMMKSFARDGAKHNILVNTIRPGRINTPMWTKTPGYGEKKLLEREKLVPLGHAGKPIDIAQMALYLASDYGNFITNATFDVAGGE